MDVTPLVKAGQQIIQSYAGGKFRISGAVYETGVIVMPSEVFEWTAELESLNFETFQPLIERASELDVVLLGCGAQIKFLPITLRNQLKDAGLSVDVMDSGAACRTYNVLMAEGRRVAAALLPV